MPEMKTPQFWYSYDQENLIIAFILVMNTQFLFWWLLNWPLSGKNILTAWKLKCKAMKEADPLIFDSLITRENCEEDIVIFI